MIFKKSAFCTIRNVMERFIENLFYIIFFYGSGLGGGCRDVLLHSPPRFLNKQCFSKNTAHTGTSSISLLKLKLNTHSEAEGRGSTFFIFKQNYTHYMPLMIRYLSFYFGIDELQVQHTWALGVCKSTDVHMSFLFKECGCPIFC